MVLNVVAQGGRVKAKKVILEFFEAVYDDQGAHYVNNYSYFRGFAQAFLYLELITYEDFKAIDKKLMKVCKDVK